LAVATIDYAMVDNVFVRVGVWAQTRDLADSLSPYVLHRILDRYGLVRYWRIIRVAQLRAFATIVNADS